MIRVVKAGGKIIDDEQLLSQFCKDFAQLEGPKILVHGGGSMASRIQEALGMEVRMIEGRRVTDEDTLKIVTMVYSGWCNKHITALLQGCGCNAIGLSGCDASAIKAVRRPPRLLADGVTLVDYGLTGDVSPESINCKFINMLLDNDLTPVFCAINHDAQGNLLNTNADTIASSIAAAMHGELVYCFEKQGVLADPNDESSVIPHITPASAAKLKADGIISAGMIPKIDNALSALRAGAARVTIKHSSCLLADAGTKLTL